MGPTADRDLEGLMFEHTRWDLIRLVADEDADDYGRRQAARALNQLCEIYRAPVLAYLARRAATPQDAEDLAQEFLSLRIGPDLFANTAADKGRFRAWLLTALKNFVRDRADHARAEKRGGNIRFVPLEHAVASANETATADDLSFDACWAETVVARALERVRRSFDVRGEHKTFDILVPFICEPGDAADLAAAATSLEITSNALQVRLTRLRGAYAKYVRHELARTVSSPEQIGPEIRYLLDVLSACR